MDSCPICYADLQGNQIPNSNPPQYYSKKQGVEIPVVYDGALFWECPNCDGRWHRHPLGSYLYLKAEPYVRTLPKMGRGQYTIEDGTLLCNVHNPAECAESACAIHNPSDHKLRRAPRIWYNKMIYRVCEHEVRHPDFDSLVHILERDGIVAVDHACCDFDCCGIPGEIRFAATTESIS